MKLLSASDGDLFGWLCDREEAWPSLDNKPEGSSILSSERFVSRSREGFATSKDTCVCRPSASPASNVSHLHPVLLVLALVLFLFNGPWDCAQGPEDHGLCTMRQSCAAMENVFIAVVSKQGINRASRSLANADAQQRRSTTLLFNNSLS